MHLGIRFSIGIASVVLAVLAVSGIFPFGKPAVTDAQKAVVSVPVAAASPLATSGSALSDIPKVVSVSPQDGDSEVVLDIEDPIEVRFDASVKEFFVDFRLDPPAEVTYQNNPEKTEFKILPKTPLKPSTQYALSVFIKRRGMDDGAYVPLASSRFTTLKGKPETEQQQTVAGKLSDAKQNTVPKILQGRYIDVSLETQIMVLFEDGKAVDSYMVSSGKRGMETPKGQFRIENKVKRAWSKTYGLYMPYWMAITPSGKFGIHELPEWPSGYKEGASHLGRPVSHGCVRLGVGSAQRTWEWAEVGTPVVVH